LIDIRNKPFIDNKYAVNCNPQKCDFELGVNYLIYITYTLD